MKCSVFILPQVEKTLGHLPSGDYQRVLHAIRQLKDNPRPTSALKLVAREGWRPRVGRYRIIYEIENRTKTVIVIQVGHRREVYR